MAEEFGPWIEHDGKGCPCIGAWVQAEFDIPPVGATHGTVTGRVWEGRPTGHYGWVSTEWCCVQRYRLRRPDALRDLIDLVENLPAPAQDSVPTEGMPA